MISKVEYPDIGGIYDESDVNVVTQLLQKVAQSQQGFFPQPDEQTFQQAFASFEGGGYCVALSSCGTALDACLAVLGIREGDEVITTPLTFIATASSIALRGAKVVLADINHETLNLCPDSVRAKISKKTKCILPVHFAGLPCDVLEFERIQRDTGIPVIYDSAHAVGVRVHGRPLASYGTASCYSFQFNKLMTCLGEGGAIVSSDNQFIESIRQLRTFGFKYPRIETYEGGEVVSLGTNYQLNRVQYAVGINQINKLNTVLSLRRTLIDCYSELLEDIQEIVKPVGHGNEHGSLHYIIRPNSKAVKVSGRALASQLLNRYGVQTRHHYPPLWKWPALRRLGITSADCPVAESICDDLITLPLGPLMTVSQCEYVAESVRNCFK